jgi:hypothetical protein
LDAGLLRSPQSAAVESHRRLRWISILCAGQARRSSRWIAQSLRSEVSPEAERVPTGKPSRRAGPVSPGYRVATGGLAPTASGANSVASALGASPGATPARLCEHTMRVAPQPSKPELSTWLGVGTFYLAPTGELQSPLRAAKGFQRRGAGRRRINTSQWSQRPRLAQMRRFTGCRGICRNEANWWCKWLN